MTDHDTKPVIPDTDILGVPTASYEWARSHWAVLINAPMNEIPGPHLLACDSKAQARTRLDWWLTNHPDAAARLIRRKVVERFGDWEFAQ